MPVSIIIIIIGQLGSAVEVAVIRLSSPYWREVPVHFLHFLMLPTLVFYIIRNPFCGERLTYYMPQSTFNFKFEKKYFLEQGKDAFNFVNKILSKSLLFTFYRVSQK